MAGYYKWIAAGVALFLSGGSPFAGFLGFLFGLFIDKFSQAAQFVNEGGQQGGQHGRSQFRSSQDIYNFYQQRTQQYDFPTMLLALSAVIMKADNRVMKVELDFVKGFLRQQFGNQFTTAHLQTLKTFLDQPHTIPLQQICQDIRIRTKTEVRIQMLHYLFGIAKADGNVSPAEIRLLQQIAAQMGIPNMDFTSVQNMFHRERDSDYKVLGIEKSATDEEIKKAYRKMAIRYHPDKVAQMGEEYQKGAKEKFQKINDAYENLKKSRKII